VREILLRLGRGYESMSWNEDVFFSYPCPEVGHAHMLQCFTCIFKLVYSIE
jgi:hypothetical protein